MNARLLRARPLAAVTLFGLLALGLAGCASASAAAVTHHDTRSEDVVRQQFVLFNAGMASGDFSALEQLYDPDATLTKSGPNGVTTTYHGWPAISAYYQSLHAAFPKYQWTTDSLRSLSEDVVLAYEHAGSPPLSVAGRCEHVFVVHAGKIVSYDWTVFYPGKP
jgi:hypothetical protein